MRHINNHFSFKWILKILVVDDSVDITEALEMTLDVLGHDFSSTNSGKEAVGLIKNNSFDAILLDLAMPGFSGLDVIRELESITNVRDLNIIIFSASVMNESEVKELTQKGVRGVIRKPIDIKVLENEIKRIISIW